MKNRMVFLKDALKWMVKYKLELIIGVGFFFMLLIFTVYFLQFESRYRPERSFAFEPVYDLYFSTRIEGNQSRDVSADSDGNVFITGNVKGEGFPATLPTIGSGGGNSDAFVAKFSPEGLLLWAVKIGGPNYDKGYGAETDSQGNVVISGRAGEQFPTKNAFQGFRGSDNGTYGLQNAFVAKLSGDGNLIWASYAGTAHSGRDVAVDRDGGVYVTSGDEVYKADASGKLLWRESAQGGGGKGSAASVRVNDSYYSYLLSIVGIDGYAVTRFSPDGQRLWTKGVGQAFISTHNLGVDSEGNAFTVMPGGGGVLIAKLSPDGEIIASTTFGGSGGESPDGVCTDGNGNLFVAGMTDSIDLPVTNNAYQTAYGGNTDAFFAIISNDLSQVSYATYFGGPGTDGGRSGCLGTNGDAYLTGTPAGDRFPLKNAFSTTGSMFLAKFKLTGSSTPPPTTPINSPTPTTPSGTIPPSGVVESVELRLNLQGVTIPRTNTRLTIRFFDGESLVWESQSLGTVDDDGVVTAVVEHPNQKMSLGNYGFWIKGESHLAKRLPFVLLDSPNNLIDMTILESNQLRAGDVNGDNVITVEDVAKILSFYDDFAIPVSLIDFEMVAADVNKDGNITIADVALAAINWSDFAVPGDE